MTNQTQSRFVTEESLVAEFVAFLLKTKNASFDILREFEGGFGRPDLLLYEPPSEERYQDIESLANINPRFAPLLSIATATTIFSLESLREATGVSKHSARRIVGELSKLGRLKMDDATQQTFKISPVPKPPFRQVVAIEAKLSDWRRALIQAYRYLQFSNESWVLLDHKSASSALKRGETFKSCGVGLASFSTGGSLYVHFPAKNRAWSNGILAWRTQALLARSLNSL
jgi:hypothetical protein